MGASLAASAAERPSLAGLVSEQSDEVLFPESSRTLGRFLMEYALGSGTSTFAKWLQDFCEGKGASMAEGTTENKNIFPLPLPSAVDLVDALDTHQDEDLWVYLLVASLNYMHGGNGAHFNQRPPSTVQKLCLDYLRSRVQAFMSHSFTLSEFDWKDFFSTQSLNYVGDEVKTAKWTTWANLEPALPYGHIGAINVLDLADGGVRELLMDPLQFLKPRWDERPVRSSRVMVQEAAWGEVARGLVKYNLCAVLPESALVAPGGVPLRNGLFGIEKGEVANGHAVHRLIMNLVPFNTVSLSIEGDVGTLPMLSQMNCLQLHPQEFLVVSSEDIRCMYYLFALPSSWYPFLSLNMPAPQDLVPPHVEEPCFLVSKVLPMGYLNSVGIAQHLHRNLITRAQGGPTRCVPWAELRKDRAWSQANPVWRVYLDNLDVLERVRPELAVMLEGSLNNDLKPLIQEYEETGVPLNAKKSVKQSTFAEVQGAEIDGKLGLARPKGDKLAKYTSAVLSLLRRGWCSQREMQVAAGGLVYFAMFRRPLMSVLNFVWRFIQSFEITRQRRLPIPTGVQSELLLFLGLLPLAHIDFRVVSSDIATASDASCLGGGICASDGLTELGAKVAVAPFRGQQQGDVPDAGLVCISLFDGISAARVALEVLQARVCLQVSVEPDLSARRVVEANFSDVIHVAKVEDITAEMCREWASKSTRASLVLLTAGPPCQGVSSLNAHRKGAMDDERSRLHFAVQHVLSHVREAFPWCRTAFFQESVWSMDAEDRKVYTQAAQVLPYRACCSGMVPCKRDRLYWFDWSLESEPGVTLYPPPNSAAESYGQVVFNTDVDTSGLFKPGWAPPTGKTPGTFTTAQPSLLPRPWPAGLARCDESTLQRWRADRHRFPPYQYRPAALLYHPDRPEGRIPDVQERERLLGFPVDYSFTCLPKNEIKANPLRHEDVRMTLLGNSWSVPVVAYFFLQLLKPLRLCRLSSLRDVLLTLFTEEPISGEALLSWRALRHSTTAKSPQVPNAALSTSHADSASQVSPSHLTTQLATLASMKGEDVLIQMSHDARIPQKFRRSVPVELWTWKEICGWRWAAQSTEHINRLELRAVYTSLRWRLLRRKEVRTKFVHLTDSLVSLHVINRGRSSSVKIQTLMYRVASLLLATGFHPCLAYVSTHTNPADRPSRRARVRKKWSK